MANDIIGTHVERVIPAGWSVVRAGTVNEDDVAAWDTLWRNVNSYMVGAVTDVNGYATVNEGRTENTGRMRLVIRRNAPEPSVEEMDTRIAAKDREIERLRNLVAEVKSMLAGARFMSDNNAAQRDDATTRFLEAVKERDEWKKAAELNGRSVARLIEERDELKAKVAELEETIRWYKQLHDADKAKVAELEKERDQYKARHGELASKWNSLKKAWGGA